MNTRLLFPVLLAVCLAGCAKDENVPEPPVVETGYFESVGEVKLFTGGELVKEAFELGEGETNPFGNSSAQVKVEEIRYYTSDPAGNRVIASGIVSYPSSGNYEKIVLAEHITVSSDAEVPSSRMCAMESALSLFGCLVISPDYLGFGASKDLRHPYLHAENTARVSIDMVFAVREYMASLGKALPVDIYIVGYSQGGAAALAAQREIEKSHAGEFNIRQTMAGGGPYDLKGMFDDMVANDYTAYPCAVPMIILGLDYGDGLAFDYSKVFKDPLLSNYNRWINSKNYTTGTINGYLATNKLSDLLHADAFTTTKNSELDKLYASLEKNSLLDWTPKAPIMLVHGRNDAVVPPFCSQNAHDSFIAKGADVSFSLVDGDHKGAAIPFYIQVLLKLAF